jgi:hypothetical protein
MVSKKSGDTSGTPLTRPPRSRKSSAYRSACRRSHAPQGGRHLQLSRPLRAAITDTDYSGAEITIHEEAVSGKTNRPPPIMLTSKTILIQLQKQLKTLAKMNLSSEERETDPESSPKVWRISKSSNPTSLTVTTPITPSFPTPRSP